MEGFYTLGIVMLCVIILGVIYATSYEKMTKRKTQRTREKHILQEYRAMKKEG